MRSAEHAIRWRRLALFLLLAPAGAHADLPEQLELKYTLHYGKLLAGHTVKTLTREPDGGYRHSTWTRPAGLARVFTSAEWFEEGRLRVKDDAVQPLSYLKYREGGRKPRRHSAVFDWAKQLIRFHDGRELALPAGTQDEGSILFAFMLRPPAPKSEQSLHVTNGKKLVSYRYLATGTETLATPLGALRTLVLKRLPQEGAAGEDLTLWLALDRRNIPVKMRLREDDREATLLIESAGGI